MNNSSNVLKKRGKSFFWASVFFSKEEREKIETLYSFCRYIDDIGDSEKFSKSHARQKLNKIILEINNNRSEDNIVSNFLKLSQKCSINNKIPIDLIKGVMKDQKKKVNIKTLDELVTYSFQVAGTVGLMMCSIMNVNFKSSKKPAVELGIAMQLTNISRDIMEDLLLNRMYLPKEIRNFLFINSSELLSNFKKKTVLSNDVIKLLNFADKFYNLSLVGINSLPFKHKFPIFLALELYKNIGNEIRKNSFLIWEKRIFVSRFKKIMITFKCLIITIFFTIKIKKGNCNSRKFEVLIEDRLRKLN